MSEMTYAEINAFGARVQAELLDGDRAIIISFGVHPDDGECDGPNCTATVRGNVGNQSQEFTSHALRLADAIRLARGRLRSARAKYESERAEAKAAA